MDHPIHEAPALEQDQLPLVHAPNKQPVEAHHEPILREDVDEDVASEKAKPIRKKKGKNVDYTMQMVRKIQRDVNKATDFQVYLTDRSFVVLPDYSFFK